MRQLYEEGKELELQRLETVQSSVQHERAQLEGQLQLLDAATQDMHMELELVNDPVVSQHFPERCEQSREALAEAIRDTSTVFHYTGRKKPQQYFPNPGFAEAVLKNMRYLQSRL